MANHTPQNLQLALGEVPRRYKSIKRLRVVSDGGKQAGTIWVPDLAQRMSYIATDVTRRRSNRMLTAVVGEDIVYEETYLGQLKLGVNNHDAKAAAFKAATSHYEDKQSLPAKMQSGVFDDNQFIHQLLRDGEVEMRPGLSPANAPTPENAQARGLAASNPAPHVLGPRGVATSSLGATKASISQARDLQKAAQRVRSSGNVPEAAEGVKYYRSVDGTVYGIQTRDAQGNALRGAAITVLTHALAELVKGGDPLKALGACFTTVEDASGQIVINFQEMMVQKYGAPTEEDDEKPTGVGMA